MLGEPERKPDRQLRKLKPCQPLLEDGPFKISGGTLKLLVARPFVPKKIEGLAGAELEEWHELERRRFYEHCFRLEREAKTEQQEAAAGADSQDSGDRYNC